MSKHEDFKTIIDEIADLKLLNLLWKNIDDKEAEKQSLRLIRVFRQYIERLRRIVDDEQPNEDAEDAYLDFLHKNKEHIEELQSFQNELVKI